MHDDGIQRTGGGLDRCRVLALAPELNRGGTVGNDRERREIGPCGEKQRLRSRLCTRCIECRLDRGGVVSQTVALRTVDRILDVEVAVDVEMRDRRISAESSTQL